MRQVMRQVMIVLLLWVVLVALLSAQDLIDPDAYLQAYNRWGQVARVGEARGEQDTYWTKQVGYHSPGCVNDFTVIGAGVDGTWRSAFANADASPAKVWGPYAGNVSVVLVGFSSNSTLAGMTVYVDGVTAGVQEYAPPVEVGTGTFVVDTTMLTSDYHVVCASVTNGSLVGRTPVGALFKVDQTVGKNGAVMSLAPGNPVAGVPGVQFVTMTPQ
jgi:hypothetical protein